MSSRQLIALRRKKINLENGVRSLGKKEKALETTAKLLQARVEGLKEGLRPQKHSKTPEAQERLVAQQQQEEVRLMKTSTAPKRGLNLKRVRLSSNVVFSWGYKKLS